MKMKLAVLMAMTLVACEKQETPPPEPPSTPAATPPATPVAVATPWDLAPEGIFFLTQKVSVETSDSILGFKPGEPVKLVKDDVYAAQDGTQLTLRPDQVTNSMSRARALASNDARVQALIAQRRSQTPVPTPFVAQPPQPLETPAARPSSVTSLGADSIHSKTRSYFNGQKWVTVHVD